MNHPENVNADLQQELEEALEDFRRGVAEEHAHYGRTA
jgi:hypothetical protein